MQPEAIHGSGQMHNLEAGTSSWEWSTTWCWTRCIPADQPLRTSWIKGDGNCLFCAFSAVITGSQDDHALLWTMTVSYMLNNLDTMWRVCPNIGEHVNTSNMATLRTWDTEVEIFALATILNVTVYVLSQRGQVQKWLPYTSHYYLAIKIRTQGRSSWYTTWVITTNPSCYEL